MAIEDTNSGKPETEDLIASSNSEFCVHYSDPTNYVLTMQKLNGENYSQWSRSAEISLLAKNKLGFVTGTCAKPTDLSKVSQWERSNSIVMSWLLHLVEPDIASSVLYCKSAKDIWSDLSDRYGQSNAPRLYQLRKELSTTSQGNNSIAGYFTQLKIVWDEYLSLLNLPACSCGTGSAFITLMYDHQVLQFLMGLNDDY